MREAPRPAWKYHPLPISMLRVPRFGFGMFTVNSVTSTLGLNYDGMVLLHVLSALDGVVCGLYAMIWWSGILKKWFEGVGVCICWILVVGGL